MWDKSLHLQVSGIVRATCCPKLMLQNQAKNSIENLVTICWTTNNIFHVIRPVALNIEFPFLRTLAVEIQMAECQKIIRVLHEQTWGTSQYTLVSLVHSIRGGILKLVIDPLLPSRLLSFWWYLIEFSDTRHSIFLYQALAFFIIPRWKASISNKKLDNRLRTNDCN